MNPEILARLTDLISKRIEMMELVSCGHLYEDFLPPTARIGGHPGTPIVLTWKETVVAFSCRGGAVVAIEFLPEKYSPALLFRDPLPDEEGWFFTPQPMYQFFNGPLDFYGEEFWIDSIVFIERNLGERFDGLAAVIFRFHSGVQFGFTAVHESHFSYFFDDNCIRLIEEAGNSPLHQVTTIQRAEATPITKESILWWVS